MSDLFKIRMQQKGNYTGDSLKNQSDKILVKTFMNDLRTRKVHVYHPFKKIDIWTFAKYQEGNDYTISKDQVDVKLQFKPQEHYPIGCYVDVPDDTGEYNTWLIVGRNDKAQFVRYNILKCNWTFRWIYNGIVHECLGCLRSRNSYNSGVWSDGYITSVENQNSFWVPTTPITQTIYYDTRFLITENKIHPISYFVTKIEDTFPTGVIKVVLKQDHFNPTRDNVDLMIADYYQSPIEPDYPSPTPDTVIKFNGVSPKLIIGGTPKTCTAYSIIDQEEILSDGVWEFDLNGFDVLYNIEQTNNTAIISASKDYSLVNQVITIRFIPTLGKQAEIEIEVAAR